MADAGWLGIAMPEDCGGSGLGITEAAIMMQAVAESGGGMAGASSIHGPVFSMEPIRLFGTVEQQQRMIPPVLSGAQKICFGVTEPNTGLDTTKLRTRAVKCDGGYLVTGEKIWITNAHVADKIMLLVRTTPLDQVKRKRLCRKTWLQSGPVEDILRFAQQGGFTVPVESLSESVAHPHDR